MPATSIRDLTIHGGDLIAGTHGRGFWILDDITALRQMSDRVKADAVTLFQPEPAIRWRFSRYPDTPLPPEEPAGQNPPDGAIIDYYLKSQAAKVTIEILDHSGKPVRTYSSADIAEPIDPELNVPTFWVRIPANPSSNPGMHRFVWDLHYTPPYSKAHEYPISAIPHNTPKLPQGAAVLPGDYTVRLTADGQTFLQTLHVTMDPRIKTPAAGLEKQFDLTMRVTNMMNAPEGRADPMNRRLGGLLNILQSSDATPTTQAEQAVNDLEKAMKDPAARAALNKEPVEEGDEP